jgi:hypothetical protein
MVKLSKYEKLLGVMFLLTLPLLQPWVHGDGRGYYAFARALMFQHNLDFSLDWYKGHETDPRFSEPGFRKNYETSTGHITNHWTIGPAILWSPFLISAHVVAEIADKTTGSQFASDGYSIPYMAGMALGTFFYGFLALLFSQRFASRYVEEKWAFLATVAIWLATSFTFYLYVEPSFSHTLSAFLVALFIYEWDRTRENRTWLQWLALGAIAGLMLDTYYPNALVLLLPASDSLFAARKALRERAPNLLVRLAGHNLIFGVTALLVFVPTLITKKILYGSYLSSGYKEAWYWYSPAFLKVCFSSHGVFSWTPILLFALLGLWFSRKADRALSFVLLATVLAFIYLIGCYESWEGIPSFGSRFFISLSAIFVLGLGAFMSELSLIWKTRRIAMPAAATILLFTLWNFGLMFQFVTHMFPQAGEVSWRAVAYNQVAVVPSEGARLLKDVLTRWAKFKPTVEPSQQRNSLVVAPHS